MKTHFDSQANLEAHIWSKVSTRAPLHGTAYKGGVGGIEVTNHVANVDCKFCLKKMEAAA